jgi:hypothetical protein
VTLMENVQNEYELTTDELGMIKPMIEAVETMQKETQAVLRAITRLRNLQGNWNLVGDKLVKIEPNGNHQ